MRARGEEEKRSDEGRGDLQLCPAAAVVQADSGAARRGALYREGTHSKELVALACSMGTRRKRKPVTEK